MDPRATATSRPSAPPTSAPDPGLGFMASTGRTATMFLATTLDSLPGVAAFHEGHEVGGSPSPRLPLINLQNRQAWYDAAFARRTVSERRDRTTILAAASGADLAIDIAFYNAPLLPALISEHPTARILAIFRRCESFIRSATIVSGEDLQPAGWPDPAKPLTDRERFIEMGRLQPAPDTAAAETWPQWSGVQRNIWLWHEVNRHLTATIDQFPRAVRLFYEDLVDEPHRFWSACLAGLGLDRPGDLEMCVERSGIRMNARLGYQVGPADSWSQAERDLHERMALPLEEQIYDHR